MEEKVGGHLPATSPAVPSQPLRQTAEAARREEKVTHPDLISRKSELDTKRGRAVIWLSKIAKSALH